MLTRFTGSELERRWLRTVENRGLRLPTHAQFNVEGIQACADFAYEDAQVLVFIDGPPHDTPDAKAHDADLTERLDRLGVDAIKEGYYAEDKRADIRVSFGGASGFNVPIEIKKDNHSDLWRAVREQLIERYIHDPGADGFGIYLVFWFGGRNMPLPQEGKKPRSAAELEERLRQTLTVEESRRIRVCVIDCALP